MRQPRPGGDLLAVGTEGIYVSVPSPPLLRPSLGLPDERTHGPGSSCRWGSGGGRRARRLPGLSCPPPASQVTGVATAWSQWAGTLPPSLLPSQAIITCAFPVPFPAQRGKVGVGGRSGVRTMRSLEDPLGPKVWEGWRRPPGCLLAPPVPQS